MVVKENLANMRERLTHVQVHGEKKNEIEEMMEEYVMQCETAMSTGKREDLPKRLIIKLDEQARDRQDKALAKAISPAKTAAETAALTPTVTTSNASISTVAVVNVKGKEEGSERMKQKDKLTDVA